MTAAAKPTEFLRVSYSSLNTAHSCWRRFEFHKLYPKINSGFEDFYAAEVGKALHAGFQEYLISSDENKAIWAFMQAFPYEGEFMQENDYRSHEAALNTLFEMFAETRMKEYELAQIRRPNTPKEIAAGLSGGVVVPAIEVPFAIRFNGLVLPDGRGIEFIGYIDAVMRHLMTGLFRSTDIKTHRQNLKDSTAKYQYDSQQTPYGLVIDHIAGEPQEGFEVLYLDSYIDILEPRVTFYPFMRTRTDIEEWVTNKVIQFQQLIRFAELDYFPRREDGCLLYNKPCKYIEPCRTRDRDALTQWFTFGSDDLAVDKDNEFMPWIVAEIDVGGI